MKAKQYTKAALALILGCAATACDENAWNDHLDGFKENDIANPTVEDVRTIEYTLSDAEYSTIASNATNKELAGTEGATALAQVGSLKRFSAEAPASKYVPAFLESTSFPYFTLTDGSAVKMTYKVAEAEPQEYLEAQDVQIFTIDKEMYAEYVWKSENYVTAFAPSMPAADYLPGLLTEYADAGDGLYCVVNYEQALQEPVFGGGEVSAVPEVVFEQTFTTQESYDTFTTDNALLPEELTYVWAWGGANYGAKASAYKDGTNYASEAWLISPEIDLTGYTGANMIFDHVVNKYPDLDFAIANSTLWGREKGGDWQQITIPEYTKNDGWAFASSGTIDLSAFDGKVMQFAFKYVSELGKSGTWEVKNLVMQATPAARSAAKAAVFVPTETRTAVYHYANGAWNAATDFVALAPSDYTAMGQKYTNLSAAEPFLSIWLKNKYPYAAKDDIKYVFWANYANGATTTKCSAYIFDGSEWTPNTFIVEETNQFVKNGGKWIYDPNVTINLPAGKSQPLSTLYFQACVDWVFENVCKPLGDTNIKSGKFYISSYGNNEYYSGTSAYQGNVDLRASAAKAQYPAEYESMSDEAVVALEKKRFMEEVMPGALSMLHPDAKPLDGLDILFTINFAYYDGATKDVTAVFKVVGPGKFEPVSCTWDN